MIHTSHDSRASSRGAVSIFIVIFTTLLISTVVVSFIRLMIQEQQQATSADLSQSALDSANAGVEDAKRALVRYRNYCQASSTAMATDECTRLTRALNTGSSSCDTIQQSGVAGQVGDDEVLIKQDENAADSALQQAYTCVKVTLNTSDYVAALQSDVSRMVPLKATGDYDRVTIEWFSQSDLKDASEDSNTTSSSTTAQSIALSADSSLPKLSDWPGNQPALLRVQLIQYGSSFQLSDFDKHDDGTSNAYTLFLLPSEAGRTSLSFTDDARQSSVTGALQQVACDKDFSTTSATNMYACKAILVLPKAMGQSDNQRTAYLRVNELYNNHTSFRVSLANDTTPVTFSSVQPIVDSTGRANDLFRRVQSRIELGSSSFPYPQSSLDLSGSLCKTFLVTDRTEDYVDGECKTE